MRIPHALFAFFMLAAGAAGAQGVSPADVDALPQTPPLLVEKYGPGELQFGELRLPEGKGPFPLAVVIHGGCWTKGFATLRNTAPIASALAAKGLATWNIEYRQVGDDGGGWPGTFQDWGAAVDHVRVLAKNHPIDLARVSVIGHSAGAHAALWVAARNRFKPDHPLAGKDPVAVDAVFALDGPTDLASLVGRDAEVCGMPVIVPLMGGTPAEQPERYAEGSPAQMLPLGARQFLVASAVLAPTAALAHAQAAGAKGDAVQVLAINTGHFEVIAPGREEWRSVEGLILANTLPERAAGAR